MAIISSNYTSTPNQDSSTTEKLGYGGAKLMQPGEYQGKIYDIGFVSTKENDRNILFIDLMRMDPMPLSPRCIRARFDLWSPNRTIEGYAHKNIASFLSAMNITGALDTEDPLFIAKLIDKCFLKNIGFVVDVLDSRNGNYFNSVQCFFPPRASGVATNKTNDDPNHSHVQEKVLETAGYTKTSNNNFVDDEVPF